MPKEEIKQYLRNQIDFSVKTQTKFKHIYLLSYNKNYLRALKFSKINGLPVNKDDFNGGDDLFWINTVDKEFLCYPIIGNYLYYNYSNDYKEQRKILKDVLNEYEEYKDYNIV